MSKILNQADQKRRITLSYLNRLHAQTYNELAEEYELRVKSYLPTTKQALSPFVKSLSKNDKVIDVGCGVGYTTAILFDAGLRPQGIDLSHNMVEYARSRNPSLQIICGDFMQIKYPSRSFDGVLLFSFLHLFPYQQAIDVLDKVGVILKKEGLLYLTTTKSMQSLEGFEAKRDYSEPLLRYRRHWTSAELEQVLTTRYEILNQQEISDPYGKLWRGYLCRK